MEDPTAHRIWDTALGQLQLQVTRPNFDTWLKDTVGLRTENGSFIVGTPSDFVSEWLSAKMGRYYRLRRESPVNGTSGALEVHAFLCITCI